jgi:hypothetical protein
MIRFSATLRSVRIGAIGALALSCALGAAADSASGKSKSKSKSKSTHSTVPQKTTSTSSHARHSTSSTSTGGKKSSAKSTGKRSSARKSSRDRGQQKIDSVRATAIQQALIREHYLTGEPAGTWDEVSEEAMRRYQADHGWQSKTVPDSRALISLGLGPSKDHLLNPESAMTTTPDAPKSQNASATSHPSPPATAPMTPASSPPAAIPTPSTNDTPSPQ